MNKNNNNNNNIEHDQTFEKVCSHVILCRYSDWGKTGAKGIKIPITKISSRMMNDIQGWQNQYNETYWEGEIMWSPVPDNIFEQIKQVNTLH